MIGKVKTGRSFRGCLLYCLNDKRQKQGEEKIMENRAEVIAYNQCYGNAKELTEQFNDVRNLNRGLSRPVMHVTLSLSPGEKMSKPDLVKMSEDCAREFGFDKNQYVVVLHKDSKHEHIHIIANRVGYDVRTVSDSNSYRKMAQTCRKLEIKYELEKVLSPRLFLSKEDRLLPRLDERKLLLKREIEQSLKEVKTLREFEARMKEKGYEVAIGRGISFTDSKQVKVKGSELNYSLKTIEQILEKQRLQEHQVLRPRSQYREQTPEQSREHLKEKTLQLDKHRYTERISKALDHTIAAREREESMPYELTQEYKRKKHKQERSL